MIRCCVCMTWFHELCLNLPPAELAGVWTCHTCRELPNTVNRILDICSDLRDKIFSLTSRLDDKELKILQLEEEIIDRDRIIKHKSDEIVALHLQLADNPIPMTTSDGTLHQITEIPLNRTLTYRDAFLAPKPPNSAIRDVLPQPQRPSNIKETDAQSQVTNVKPSNTLRSAARVFFPRTTFNDPKPIQPTQRTTTIKGSLNVPSMHRVAAAPRRSSVRVNFLSLDTQAEDLCKHVREKLLVEDIQVEHIEPPPTVTQPTYNCFKVSGPHTVFQQLLSPELWPTGLTVKPFRTRRVVPNLQ